MPAVTCGGCGAAADADDDGGGDEEEEDVDEKSHGEETATMHCDREHQYQTSLTSSLPADLPQPFQLPSQSLWIPNL